MIFSLTTKIAQFARLGALRGISQPHEEYVQNHGGTVTPTLPTADILVKNYTYATLKIFFGVSLVFF